VLVVLKIPPANWPFFRDAVARLIANAHRESEPWHFRPTEVAEPLDRIAALAAKLKDALSAASRKGGRVSWAAHARLDMELRRTFAGGTIWPDVGQDFDHVDHWVGQIGSLRDAASKAAANARSDLDKFKFGRPPGIGEHPGLAEFIGELVFEVLCSGGTVSLDKRNEKGRLIVLLEALRKHLPKAFLPNAEEHPVSTYRPLIGSAVADWEAQDRPIVGV
jgi:hypothetical protein